MCCLNLLDYCFSFPFDINYSPLFELIFIASLWSGFTTTSCIYGGDGLFLGICSHLSAQFDIIGSKLKTLCEREIENHESKEKFTKEENDRLYKELMLIVKDHNDAIDFSTLTSKTLWPNVLIHYISSALITCICALMVLLAEGPEKIVFVSYIMASTTQVYVYSIGASMMEASSMEVKQAAYDFSWYKCDSRNAKVILMIMMRTGRKTGIDVPFFEASLETFAAIIKTAGSYITMFKTFL